MSRRGFEIRVEGMDQVLRKLRGEGAALYAEPLRAALRELAARADQRGRAVAPRATGQLVSKLTHKVSARAVPRWALVKTTARNKDFSYPRLLEYSPKHGHQGWLRRAVRQSLVGAQATLDRAARRIEALWRA